MRSEKLLCALGELDEDLVTQAVRPGRRRRAAWGAAAACLCAVLACAMLLPLRPETPAADTRDGPPSLRVDGRTYYISPYLAVSDDCPAGFVCAGMAPVSGVGDCAYYANPDTPEWIYVRQTVRTDGTVDAHGTLRATAPHTAYARYVDARIRGADYVRRGETLYVSLWSAHGDDPDYAQALLDQWGLRIEGDPPAGFQPAGSAVFTGHDTVPDGPLGSNTGEEAVWFDPNDDRVLLVSTVWHTAAPGESGDTRHTGFNVYVLCGEPLA